jgi:hypothetical protein
MKRIIYLVAFVAVFFGLWWATYPDRYDPKNPHYVLWKHHLAPMDLDRATSDVALDPDRNAMILGRTKLELAKRFGYLKTSAEVRPYLRNYCLAARPGADAMFLRNHNMMIVFIDGRATEVVTCKG